MKTGHVQAQGVVDTMTQPVVVLDQHYCVTTANNAFIKAFQVERENVLSQNFFGLGDGQWNIPDLRQLLSFVIPRSAAVIGFEVTHTFPTLGQRTFLVDARRLVHPDDNSPNLMVIFEDVTERRRHDAEMDFIIAEMRHRMKNQSAVALTVVKNIRADDPAAARLKESVLERLGMTFLSQEIAARGVMTEYETLLRESVGPTVASRLECSGPPVELQSAKVVPASMILHELATNAMKHGSVSVPDGKVRVTWELEAGKRGRNFLLCHWREEAGPRVSRPERKGYGTDLIEGLAAHIGGSAELTYPPDGFKATIKIPL
ncbi:blue-light-activated histidine kinase [Rhizobium grahamii CCGE 502]|uniref:histidine kinase n=2 Tax=Rhizobium grahamii TaxID=1120045 RepID=S3IIE4_9HYPH|nr:blue-light-activated histidine kinase [Rhizobium grahamii CCGE 502]